MAPNERFQTGSNVLTSIADAGMDNEELLPSDLILPVIAAIREGSEEVISRLQLESRKCCDQMREEMKEMMKKWEDKFEENSRRSVQDPITTTKKSGGIANSSLGNNAIGGIAIICEDEKLTNALSTWFCGRVASDLKLFWSSSSISGHNSSLSVSLFGIQRKEGLGPYKSSLGVDLGLQAREIVGRLMWNARCAKRTGISFTGSIPKWLYAFVPVCRHLVAGNNISRECIVQSDSGISSSSSKISEANVVMGYDDLTDSGLAWKKESALFREAVMEGCRSMEIRKPRERARKISRYTELDAMSQESLNRRITDAKSEMVHGAQAVRKHYSYILSQNRFNARERFYDAIGFLLYYIRKHGVEAARAKGFFIDIQDMSQEEEKVFTNSTEFNSSIPAADTRSDDINGDVNLTNRERMEKVIRQFPCLTVKCSYKVTVEQNDERGESASSVEDGTEHVPKTIDRIENVNLLSLSTIVLTELSRAGTGLAFIRTSKRSLQAILITAMAFHCLICKTIRQKTTAIEDFVLGNVYLLNEDIPSDNMGNSTFIAFLQEDSNERRLKNKLKATTKQYMLEKENEVHTSGGGVLEQPSEYDVDDIFVVPVQNVVD